MQPRLSHRAAGRVRAFLRAPSPADPPLPPPGAPGGAHPGLPDGAPPGPPDGAHPGPPDAASGGAPPAPVAAGLDDLRRAVARLEGRIEASARLAPSGPAAPAGLVLGVPDFDGLFPAGLPFGAVHVLRAAESREAGALGGFVTTLAAALALARRGPVLWVREAAAAREAGRTAALGLAQLGLDPGRLIAVDVARAADLLWAVEEGLGCPGLAAVVGEVQGQPRVLDLTATRRLALRAREGGVPLLLALQGAPPAPSAAATRFRVAPRFSEAVDGFEEGAGFPAWTLVLEKNRGGRTGRLDLEWNSDARRFRALPPRPLPRRDAAPPADGPAGADAPGALLAFGRRAG